MPEYHRFAHRQRIEFVHAYDIAAVAAARGRFDGQTFTKAEDTKDRVKTSETRLFRELFTGREKLLMTARLPGAKQIAG